ncbi:hypothetical protein ACIP9H_18525 [Streptomyces sp. NPDC088732]|uniref:hypothetical protein n=1 Tax=Streptomyces sp. NPDC088732 TaxID=3365879 RepID=UPI00382ADDD5
MNSTATAGPPGIRLGIARGIGYGLFGAPDGFVPQARGLGAGLVRVYVHWGRVEPEPDREDWTVVDAILAQLDPTAEVWITVCSSSPWATRRPTGFLPSSPAHDIRRYEAFVSRLVSRCRGRVAYWQCDNEPSNTGLLWAGTAPEYVAQLTAFARAVRGADPGAHVVLGGCGYDVWSSPEDGPARLFFDHLVEHGRDAFDLFSVHLYGNPHDIPAQIGLARAMMRRHGYERPVVAGEYNGPTLFELPAAQAEFERAMTAAFTGRAAPADPADPEDTPDRRTMRDLYARADELPAELRMFMEDCPPGLAARRDRINCRQIVTRNILALASGVTRTVCWNLAPEIPGYRDRLNVMGFLFGKLALMDYDGSVLTRRHPSGEAFARLAAHLDGATAVRPFDTGADTGPYAFEITRDGRAPLYVLWSAGDLLTGEDLPAVPLDLPWPHAVPEAVDAFGAPVAVEGGEGTVRVPVSVTPLFLTPAGQE